MLLGVTWGWAAVFGAFSVASSVFVLLSPPTTLAAIMGLIVGFATVTGVALLAGAFKLRSLLFLEKATGGRVARRSGGQPGTALDLRSTAVLSLARLINVFKRVLTYTDAGRAQEPAVHPFIDLPREVHPASEGELPKPVTPRAAQ